MQNSLSEKDLEMVDDLYAALLTKTPNRYRLIIWTMFVFVLVMITWSSFASIDQVTRGSGKVIPPSQVQLIQSLDGGILKALYVQEGQLIKKDQPLAEIDDTRFRADFAQQEEEVVSLKANVFRMKKELESIKLLEKSSNWQDQVQISIKELVFSQDLQTHHAKIIENQQNEYNGRLLDLVNRTEILAKQIEQKQQENREIESKIQTLKGSKKLISREIEITVPLAKKRIVSEIEVLKLQRQLNDIEGEIEALKLQQPKILASVNEAILKRREVVFSFTNQTRAKKNELNTRLSRLTQAQIGAQDKVDKTMILSPVDGVIKTIHTNTIGGVIQPGIDLIEIVPEEDHLIVEAKVAPKDIAFLYPGLPSVVKVTAYDSTRYGGLKGEVEHISADTTQDENGESFYLVRIRTKNSSLIGKEGQNLPIIPGMLTSVDILTGKKTVLEYILNPILRAKESALRER